MKAVTYRPFGTLRFALAMAVVISHSLIYSTAADSFASAMGMGNFAVMGFFVLSGYIITEAASTFYTGRPGAFIANRFWRIAPPYWAALVISIAIHYTLVRADLLRVTDPGTPTEAMFTIRNILANIVAIFPCPGRFQIEVPGGFLWISSSTPACRHSATKPDPCLATDRFDDWTGCAPHASRINILEETSSS